MKKSNSKSRQKPASKKAGKVLTNQVAPGSGMLDGVFGGQSYGTATLSQPWELGANNQYNPLSLNRILLSYAYMTFGPIQTFVDQPVEDAFRGGLDFYCDEFDGDDLLELQKYLEENKILKEIKDALRWAKLYGGAGLIINTDSDPSKPLDEDDVKPGKPFALIAADRWELVLQALNPAKVECPYNYYGQPIHKTRVIKVMGKEAPALIRARLQGWGMSELERTIRDVNSYVKNQDLIYELLDEAKIDIWKIQGFNANILSMAAQNKMSTRLQIATQMKNYHSAIVMDSEDEYEQKQLTFSGLGDMLQQIRIGMAASVRMPMTKLFGLSAAGFNSGEDDIENYNALIESEVRAKAREVLAEVIPLCARHKFGFVPDTLREEFKPLRVLGAVDEANIRTQKFNVYDRLYSQGILDPKEYANLIENENIIPIKSAVGKGSRDPEIPLGPSATFEKPVEAVTKRVPGGEAA